MRCKQMGADLINCYINWVGEMKIFENEECAFFIRKETGNGLLHFTIQKGESFWVRFLSRNSAKRRCSQNTSIFLGNGDSPESWRIQFNNTTFFLGTHRPPAICDGLCTSVFNNSLFNDGHFLTIFMGIRLMKKI